MKDSAHLLSIVYFNQPAQIRFEHRRGRPHIAKNLDWIIWIQKWKYIPKSQANRNLGHYHTINHMEVQVRPDLSVEGELVSAGWWNLPRYLSCMKKLHWPRLCWYNCNREMNFLHCHHCWEPKMLSILCLVTVKFFSMYTLSISTKLLLHLKLPNKPRSSHPCGQVMSPPIYLLPGSDHNKGITFRCSTVSLLLFFPQWNTSSSVCLVWCIIDITY